MASEHRDVGESRSDSHHERSGTPEPALHSPIYSAYRVLFPASTNHTVCSMILKSRAREAFSM